MRTFLEEFMEYTKGTEAPASYYLWSGLAALSSIISRRVYITLGGRFVIYGNVYVVLVGPAGNGKTTALDVARNVVRDVGGIPFSAESQTKESVVVELKEAERSATCEGKQITFAPYSIFVTELSHFLGFNSGPMIDFLTAVFDRNIYDTKTKNKGNFTITGPHVTILACTTPEWITSYLKSDIISGGFSRRAVFVNEYEGQNKVPWPVLTDAQKEAYQRCVLLGKAKQATNGEVKWSPEAQSYFEDWYLKRLLPKDPAVRGYYRTKHIQMLKIALLLCVNESDEKVLRVSHIEESLAMFELAEANLPQVFQGVGRNELNAVGLKMTEFIRTHGKPMPEKELLRIMRPMCTEQEFFSIVRLLCTTEEMQVGEELIKATGVKRRVLALPGMLPAKTDVLAGGTAPPPSPAPVGG